MRERERKREIRRKREIENAFITQPNTELHNYALHLKHRLFQSVCVRERERERERERVGIFEV